MYVHTWGIDITWIDIAWIDIAYIRFRIRWDSPFLLDEDLLRVHRPRALTTIDDMRGADADFRYKQLSLARGRRSDIG